MLNLPPVAKLQFNSFSKSPDRPTPETLYYSKSHTHQPIYANPLQIHMTQPYFYLHGYLAIWLLDFKKQNKKSKSVPLFPMFSTVLAVTLYHDHESQSPQSHHYPIPVPSYPFFTTFVPIRFRDAQSPAVTSYSCLFNSTHEIEK